VESSNDAAATTRGDERRTPGGGRDPQLWDLADRYWTLSLADQPLAATLLGVHDHDDRIGDLSEGAEQEQRDRLVALRAEVDHLAAEGLSGADRITRSLLLHQLSRAVESADLRLVELASDQMDGPHAALLMIAPQLTYPEPEHADAALGRYELVPQYLEQALERFRAGLARGRTPAAAVIARSVNSLDGYLAGPVEEDPFLAAQLPAAWSGDDSTRADAWRDSLLDVVRDRIRPAFVAYRDALRDELGPAARDDEHAGWGWLPDGDQLYAALIRAHTTIDTSPAALHEIGVEHTERLLPEEYRRIAPSCLGTDVLDEVFERLRNDPALRHRDAQEVVETARSTVARATAAMPRWFGRLPVAPCEVAPIPAFLAQDAPYAYYFPPATDGSRPGTYFINTADPEGASRTEAESIAFHEAIPGHHLQIAISQELDGLPEFQRHDGATSYVEGWGLYAERLADEMGLYTGELDRLGMLTADSWRSARLVVDTGLHALGWSRQRAIDYFTEHTPVPLDQILPEVDRYLAIPAQALSYKVGQLEIQRLRSEAEQRLGDRFDLPGFHDVVLASGAVTLPVLGDLVRDWIAAQNPAANPFR
jgi:uncharacterized protein (DUF885 family)